MLTVKTNVSIDGKKKDESVTVKVSGKCFNR